MCRHPLVLGVWALSLACPIARADGPPPAAPAQPAASDRFARIAPGQVGFERTARGWLVLSNLPGNRYTYELVGADVRMLQQKTEGKNTLHVFTIDGVPFQTVALALAPEADPGNAEPTLRAHQKYESDHIAEGGWTEDETARKWLKFPSGAPALAWEMVPPKDRGNDPNQSTRLLLANTLNGRNVILMTATLFATTDAAKARRLLVDTLMTLARYEKAAEPKAPPEAVVDAGDATTVLLNDELATRKDRKSPGAMVVNPDRLILMTRMAVELEPDRIGGFTMFLFDGQQGHVATLDGYDRRAKAFLYSDTRRPSFLEEDNNRAGVKATKQAGGVYSVPEADLKKVLQGMMVPFRCVRHYVTTGELGEAIREYRGLQGKSPDSDELKEEWLLKAASLLVEGGEDARAVNLYGVCVGLHDKSSRALAGIAGIYARTGRTEPALNFYADALKDLADDPSLDDARRKELAAAWESARRELAARPRGAPAR